MSLEFRLDNNCPNDWNQNLLKSEFGNIYNTYEYSQYAKSRLDWIPSFLSIIDSNGNIISQTVLFDVKNKKFGKLSRLTNKIDSKKLSKLKWTYGPVTFSQQKEDAVNSFLEYLSKTGKKLDGIIHPLLGTNFHKHDFRPQKWSTFLIDLRQSKESILQNMEKSVRKNIIKSEKRDVKIVKITDSSIHDYHKILNQHRLESNNSLYDLEDTIELWDKLSPIGFGGYLAKKDNVVIGGITFSSFNGYLNEWGIARSQKDTTEKLYSQDLLKWKIIEWGINHGHKFYDLTGVNPIPQNQKEEGILRYKKKWGGNQFEYWLLGR